MECFEVGCCPLSWNVVAKRLFRRASASQPLGSNFFKLSFVFFLLQRFIFQHSYNNITNFGKWNEHAGMLRYMSVRDFLYIIFFWAHCSTRVIISLSDGWIGFDWWDGLKKESNKSEKKEYKFWLLLYKFNHQLAMWWGEQPELSASFLTLLAVHPSIHLHRVVCDLVLHLTHRHTRQIIWKTLIIPMKLCFGKNFTFAFFFHL